MPFYGRPSKNCESCRERRIKCDRIQPVCSQCIRAGKPCGGYRDIPALLFRDETDKAARRSATAKSRAGERRKTPVTPQVNSDSSSSEEDLKAVVQQRKLTLALNPSIPLEVPTTVEDRGLNFFCSQFVTASAAAMEGPFVLSKTSFISTISVELQFRDAVVSVGLAALSNVTRDRSLRLVAREKYAASLNAVRQAVENPLQASPPQIMKIILMIGLYEMVCCTSTQLDSWTVHLDGAAALLRQATFGKAIKARDPRAQLQFFYFSMVKYIHAQKPLPIEFSLFNIKTIQSSNPDDFPSIGLVDTLMRFMRFHHTRSDPSFDPEIGVRTAIAFDEELEEWERSLPHTWEFFIKTSTETHNTFNGKYMTYNDLWASRDLNYYFWGRLIVNETILNNIAKLARMGLLKVYHLQQRQRALDMAEHMATCICAGAATLVGGMGNGMPLEGKTHVPPLNGVFMLLFPLTIAGGSAAAPDEVHEWVKRKLQTIGSKMGIQRAIELIPRIQTMRAWKSQLMSMELQ
ncbi:hypothetical protein N7494_012329 [Penicillium frequentans]|uniref:Zn(2)-C6 fungal-type domain-containing protein n=1 Tax=Penicillium frequentans TaxID=3151616 RepID=A0AAD6GBI4_9EURO|nr:hypothetical protein N7494_012329 [Penicillium glabrum]